MTQNMKRYYERLSEQAEKAKRQRMLTGSSYTQAMVANANLVSNTEYGMSRRAPTFTARLHAAKYLKADPLFKDMLYPLFTFQDTFGFVSASFSKDGWCLSDAQNTVAAGNTDTGLKTVSDKAQWARAAAPYRGIASFTLRSSRADTELPDYKLNNRDDIVSTTTLPYKNANGAWDAYTNGEVYGVYRRFINGPTLGGTGGADSMSMTNCPTVKLEQITDNTDVIQTDEMRCMELCSVLNLERKAILSSPFTYNTNGGSAQYDTAPSGGSATYNWPGSGEHVVPDGGTDVTRERSYYSNLRDTTMRIADGYLEMDISNGKSAAALIEIVIHSHKSHQHNLDAEALYKAIWDAVTYQQRDKPLFTTGSGSGGTYAGGWQCLFDPGYPLLHVASKHRKHIDTLANEVHRSSHVLAPGQSKTVKIALGSLYYKLGNKCDDTGEKKVLPETGSYGATFPNPKLGVGALQVTIGHSGFKQLVAPSVTANAGWGDTLGAFDFANKPDEFSTTSGNVHTAPHVGFWVGKQYAPSEIIVDGKYCEKFYPMYVQSEQRSFGQFWQLPPKLRGTMGSGIKRVLLPSGLPATDIVTVNDISEQTVPAKMTGPATDALHISQ